MRNYFITGISGFLGTNLVNAIKEEGDAHIYGLVHKGNATFARYEGDKDITLYEGDIRDEKAIAAFLEEAKEGEENYLIHGAGKISLFGHFDKETMEINRDGTKKLVDIAVNKPFQRVVFVSSVDALIQGKNAPCFAPSEYDPEHVVGVYGKSKALASAYMLEAYKEKGFPVIIVNPSAIIGPNDPFLGPMNDVFKRYCQKKVPMGTPGGYDVVDVRDVANGILACLQRGKLGESYLLVGHRVSVKELFAAFAVPSKVPAPKMVAPFFLIRLIAPFVELYARIRRSRPLFSLLAVHCLSHNPYYDKEKAKADLGYVPRSLEDTMRDTYRWLKEEYHLS